MANHGYQTCSLCLLATVICKRWSLTFSNQNPASLRDPSFIWFMDQLGQRFLIDMTDSDSSTIQCRFSLVLSIRWNRDVLRCRRFFPVLSLAAGGFSGYQPVLVSLTRGYGVFIWVFDPSIISVLAEEEHVVKFVIDEITLLYSMETKKNSQAQWINSHGPMPLYVFGEDEEYASDFSFSHRKIEKSSKRRLEDFFALMEFTQACLVVIINIFCKTSQMVGRVFGVFGKDAKISKFVMSYSHLFVVVTNKKSFSEASNLSMRFALWSFNKEMFLTHTFRISERLKMEKEIANYSGSTEKRIMDINQHLWVGRYSRHDPEPFQATYQSIRSIKVMRKAFRSFIYKMIACYEFMKRGLNRFILLPVRLLLESRVTSTSSSKLGFNFFYLFQ